MSGLSSRNPFVGPRPIQPGEPLHGRDAEVLALYHRLQARRIVLLHSPSGAGKSSLVQAGLIPRLEAGHYDVWKPIRVNLDPCRLPDIPEGTNCYLLSALVSLEDELPEDRRRSPAALAALDLADYLKSRPRRKGRVGRPVVLLFDQFEEVLTVAPRAVDAKRAFFAAVGRALDSEQCWALFILREDYLGALAPYRDLVPTQLSNTFRLDLLSLQGARDAAVKVAEQGGRSFPAADQLVRDLSAVQVQQLDGTFVAEQGLHVEPVQLQVVCRRLWDAIPEDDRSIDPEDIAKYGEVSRSLAGYYADAVARSAGGDPAVERAVREWVGEKLIVGGIRSQVRQDAGQSAGLDNQIVQRLVDSYLVRTEQRAGATWLELSHDRLVEPVQNDNRAWTQKHLHPLQVQARIWEDAKRATGMLLGAEALPDAERWASDHPELLTAGEREFLAQSCELRARQRASRRRLVILTTTAVITTVVVAVLGSLAWRARGRAHEAVKMAQEAELRAVATARAAEAARDQAQRADLMACVREQLARNQAGIAALLLAEMKRPEAARGWDQLAIDTLGAMIPRFTVHHEDRVMAASWSPDGKRFVTVSEDRTARVWSVDGRGTPVVLHGHESAVHAASWSPDGTRIATASDDSTARIWNADGSGTPVVLHGHRAKVHAASWSPDGTRIVTASDDSTARVWNADGSGTPVVLNGHRGAVYSASWSPDGKRIVTASFDTTARVWNADGSGTPVVLNGHGAVYSASWSPDGKRIVTASFDSTARVWNADGSSKPVVLNGDDYPASSASWSPDGKRIAVVFRDNTVRVWDADGSSNPVVLSGPEDSFVRRQSFLALDGPGPQSASWSPDGERIATVSSDSTARVWNSYGSGQPVVLNGHKDRVTSASWSPDGTQILTTSFDTTARVWNAYGSGPPVVLSGWFTSASWSPDGTRIVTTSVDHKARVWSEDTAGPPMVLNGHRERVNSASWSPDGTRIVTASLDATARVWNADGSGTPVVLSGHAGWVTSASWSPDGTRIVTASNDETARVWNADGSGQPVVLSGHADQITSASWSPDGKRIVTASDDKTARVWNADGSGQALVLNGHADRVLSASWSPDGTRIVTASSDRTARVWNADGSGPPLVLSGHRGPIRDARWSPDGMRIATVSDDKTARVWNADGSGQPLVLSGHEGTVQSVSWSPDGKRIVTASDDRTARVWDADGSGEPLILNGHKAAVHSAAWSRDGTRIATVSDDRTARIWQISIPALHQALRNVTLDCLSPAQRETYLLETRPDAVAAYQACERAHGRTPRP